MGQSVCVCFVFSHKMYSFWNRQCHPWPEDELSCYVALLVWVPIHDVHQAARILGWSSDVSQDFLGSCISLDVVQFNNDRTCVSLCPESPVVAPATPPRKPTVPVLDSPELRQLALPCVDLTSPCQATRHPAIPVEPAPDVSCHSTDTDTDTETYTSEKDTDSPHHRAAKRARRLHHEDIAHIAEPRQPRQPRQPRAPKWGRCPAHGCALFPHLHCCETSRLWGHVLLRCARWRRYGSDGRRACRGAYC